MPASKSNPVLVDLIDALKEASREHDVALWRDVAERLERPSRVWHEVNVSRLDRVLQEDDVALVPGKVLGAGRLTKPVAVAAFQFTAGARERIEDADGLCLSIRQLLKEQPTAEGVRLVG